MRHTLMPETGTESAEHMTASHAHFACRQNLRAGRTSNRAHAVSHMLLLQAAELALQSDDVRSQPLRVALLQQ